MKWHRIRAIVLRHILDIRRNPDRIVDTIYWPVLDILIWGFLTVYLATGLFTDNIIVSFLLGAAILWGIFYAFQRDLAMGFLEELWSRNLINLFVSPLTIWEYISGLVIMNIIKTTVGVIAAASIAFLVYQFSIFSLSFYFLPYLFNILLFGLAVGFFITGLIFRYTTKVQTLAWGFAGLFQPISCVFYPLATLPTWLQPLALLLPTTHAFEGMRALLDGRGYDPAHFWWGFVLALTYVVLGISTFAYLFESTRRRGLIPRVH